MNSPVNAQIEHVLLAVIVQLIVIITASRVFGALFRKLGQPQVCGEIAAGLVLGPSLLGGLFPGVFARVFDPSVSGTFSIVSQLGLILLMFLIGLEFEFGYLGTNRRTAVSVSAAGIVLPFALGFALGKVMHGALGLSGAWLNFSLFMAASMSITAIPILGRIMVELGINRTRIGSVTISAAAIDDVAGWIILAVVSATVRSQFDPSRLAAMVVAAAAFGFFLIAIVRPRLIVWLRRLLERSGGELSLDALAALLIMVLLCSVATNLIGIFSIFGAFLFGAILHDQHDLIAAIRRRLQDFVTVFFLPIFFTYTGLRTDIGTMSGANAWMWCGLVLAAATVGKFGGCALAARANGLAWREASIIGVMMNTRALMELIVVNIGYDLGIIPKNVFFMLVFMAVFTTYITTPILRRLAKGSEIEAPYAKSEFAQLHG